MSTKGTWNGVVGNDARSGTMESGIYVALPLVLRESISPLFFLDQCSATPSSPVSTSLRSRPSHACTRTRQPGPTLPQLGFRCAIARPPLGTFESFEDGRLGPLCDGVRSWNASSGVAHVPLEHEIVASRSIWGGAAGVYGRRGVAETMVLRRGSSAAAAGVRSGIVEASRNERAGDPLGLGVASAVTLVETLVDPGTKAGRSISVYLLASRRLNKSYEVGCQRFDDLNAPLGFVGRRDSGSLASRFLLLLFLLLLFLLVLVWPL